MRITDRVIEQQRFLVMPNSTAFKIEHHYLKCYCLLAQLSTLYFPLKITQALETSIYLKNYSYAICEFSVHNFQTSIYLSYRVNT